MREHPVGERIDALPWRELGEQLDTTGVAVTPEAVLAPEECADLVATFHDDERFRSTIDMARHRFGEGSYRYFAYPLPDIVAAAREAAYPHLAAIANRWAEMLARGGDHRAYPEGHEELIARCRANGQVRPTPLILRYETGGWNALHQDVYGEVVFPLQLAIALSRPHDDFEGGEMLFVEQRPRSQSRGTAVVPDRGQAVIFPTRHRPVAGARGPHRAAMRHGVSVVTKGERYTLGIIFHDAT